LRDEVLGILDSPRPLDLFIEEGVQFNLGGGVSLQALSFPGHLLAEYGWFEASTKTLILGDAVTGLDWPLFHSHLSVQGYRDSLAKIRHIVEESGVEQVLFSHFPPMHPAETKALTFQAEAYINEIERTLLNLLAAHGPATLELLWNETCHRLERIREFRSLNMVNAHIEDLTQRGLAQQIETETYQLL
jgi:glyoxylase-like metal-dependent hydrolase (beta-lactamase superfamily II)